MERSARKKLPERRPAAQQQKPRTTLWERPGFLVRRLHQIHVAMFLQECAADNVTPVQFGLLSVVLDEPGCDQVTLAEKLGIDRTNIADVVRRLERRGWVKRVVNASDRRMRAVSLTDEGRVFVNRAHARMQRAQERLLSPLGEKERAQFVHLLQRLVAANNAFGRAKLRHADE